MPRNGSSSSDGDRADRGRHDHAPPARTPAWRCRGDSATSAKPALGLLVGDHVHVDLARTAARSPRRCPRRRCAPSATAGTCRAPAGWRSSRGRSRAGRRARRRRPRCAGWRRGWSASSRTLPICGADTPASPSPRTTCTTISSALDFDAIRDARRTSVSDSGPPVTATTTRSRASQVSVILFSARYFASAASTWSASHSSASSRSAVRLPRRK